MQDLFIYTYMSYKNFINVFYFCPQLGSATTTRLNNPTGFMTSTPTIQSTRTPVSYIASTASSPFLHPPAVETSGATRIQSTAYTMAPTDQLSDLPLQVLDMVMVTI
jgi:hypothetical protein